MDNQNSKSKKILMDVPVTRTSLRVIDNIIYSQHYEKGTISLHMTLIIPRTNEPKPCVVYFPGGGFTTSDYSKFIECRMGLARAGFVVAAVQYRTIPNAFPALLEDGKQAIRFLKANAEKFGIDKTRFGVMGNSAGGYLSSMIATTMNEPRFDQGQYLNESSDVQACCTIFGPSDLETIDEGFPTEVQAYHDSRAASEALLVNGVVYGRDPGHLLEEIPDKARAASPLGHMHPGLPPFLIMHGNNDHMVSQRQSDHLYEALCENGTEVEYVVLDKADHGDDHWFQQPVIDYVVDWFRNHLRP